jgi:hypothetical protein
MNRVRIEALKHGAFESRDDARRAARASARRTTRATATPTDDDRARAARGVRRARERA